MTKQKIVPLAALVLTVIGGSILGISRLSVSTVHAQTQTAQIRTAGKPGQVSEVKDSVTGEKPDVTVEKDTADGPSGHQDTLGVSVDHQFDGAE